MSTRIDIAYLRVSDPDQHPENQRQHLQEIAGEGTVFEVEKQSAWKYEQRSRRPVFDRIYREIERGRVRTLYVWDLDRIYRNRKLLKAFVELCHARGTRLVSYRQQWLQQIQQIPAPWNEIVYDLLIQLWGWMAEDESEKRSDRTKAGMARAKAQGKVIGRPSVVDLVMPHVVELRNQLGLDGALPSPAELARQVSRRVKRKVSESTIRRCLKRLDQSSGNPNADAASS